jgi:hypothetical protein
MRLVCGLIAVMGLLSVVLAADASRTRAATSLAAGASRCAPGSVAATVGGRAVCLRSGQVCRARFAQTYRNKSFRCVSGRLRKVRSAKPPSTTPSPPVPTGPTGVYAGTNSQGLSIEVVISQEGRVAFMNWFVVYEECTPRYPSGRLAMRNPSIPFATLGTDGTFMASRADTGFDHQGENFEQSLQTAAVKGAVVGNVVSGTAVITDWVTPRGGGNSWRCSSGEITWSATRK